MAQGRALSAFRRVDCIMERGEARRALRGSEIPVGLQVIPPSACRLGGLALDLVGQLLGDVRRLVRRDGADDWR